ncbi:Putative cryptic C4-dicarboxylate transporter DcuD [Sporomusa rhizae]|uniref:C4-dicarboxylate transporter DcuC n=1 Tax=Sporomusa rhizae TaxID=357999 RepID=UPI00352AA64C
MQIAAGVLIICGMLYMLAKRYETRMVLFGAGLLLACVAGNPAGALVEFSKSMKQSNIFEVIIASMGFAAVIKATECDKHLIAVFIKILKKMGPFLIVGVSLATTIVNISIPSAAGTSAAVGVIFIPLLISAGVPAPVAAASILAGLYGGNLNPGHVHPTIVAELAKSTPMTFVSTVAVPLIASVVASSIVLMLTSRWIKKQQKQNASIEKPYENEQGKLENFKLNYLYAILPLFPLIILFIGNTQMIPALKMEVSHAMIIGGMLTLLITRSNPQNVTKVFFKGMGDSFGEIFGLIVTANIFVAGLQALGLIKFLINYMTTSPAIAKAAAILGPLGMAIISGSGEAASIAFNKAVSVHASQFGMDVMHMGSLAVLSGGIGRSMSPVAGCVIICAGIAKVNPLDVIKYNSLAMIAALCVAIALLLI